MKNILILLVVFISFGSSSLYAANTNDNDNKIAYIGYGSLIDDPRDLPITDDFTETDLKLPIDFLRISGSYIGSSKDHDNRLYAAFCDKEVDKRDNHPLYLSVTIAPDEFAKDVTPSNVYSTLYDIDKDKTRDPDKTNFENARQALKDREGTSLSSNIAFISKSEDAPKDKEGKIVHGYKVSSRAAQLSDDDISNIISWMKEHNYTTVFVTYFASNFHDTQYKRGMGSIPSGSIIYVDGKSDRDITKWNQDNIRLLMFLVANNKAQQSNTRYDALEKFKSYIYEVPPNVKNNTTYWTKGEYANKGGLSGLITDVFYQPRTQKRMPDAKAYVDCSKYVHTPF